MNGPQKEAETAVCRGCGRKLIGKPFYRGGGARHPKTGERCPSNYFGGYVCSETCDRKVLFDMHSSFPGAGVCKTLPSEAEQSLIDHWHSGY